ncbi:MAG: efflux RND transporter periplasmic adaptor subunit [Dehalococcoidia bacterium]|jgi:RND family efflux transporter MFP subunit
MSKAWLVSIASIILTLSIIAGGCSSGPVTQQQTVAAAQRGDLEVTVTASGDIEMPEAVNLYFDTTMFTLTAPYSAQIKKIYVEKGDMVKAGALIAVLDDTAQKQNVETAQYGLETAINNVVQTTAPCCGCTVPQFYSDAVALYRFDFAMKEMQKAQTFLQTGQYTDAAEQISLANYDIDAARKIYSDPAFNTIRPDLLNDVGQVINTSSDASQAIQRFSSEMDVIASVQAQVKDGKYDDAVSTIQDMLTEMSYTDDIVKRITHLPTDATSVDTSTTYTVVNEILASMDKLQAMVAQKDVDPIAFAQTLSSVRHDLELTNKILDENISTYRLGLNLKALRDYNIAIQTAIIKLDQAKLSLLKTELLAPFDGQVVELNLHEGDMITQRYSTTGLPIDSYLARLANTSSIRMTGIVNETDVLKVVRGQKALVYVDAVPGKTFQGQVAFISPFGTLDTKMASYKVEIALDPADAAYLAGGMTATTEISIDKHTNVLLVPNAAISGQAGDYYVLVWKDEKANIVERRPVTIGLQGKTQTEIVSGLSEGEKVLLEKSYEPPKSLQLMK